MTTRKGLTIADMPKQVLIEMLDEATQKAKIPESYLANRLINHKAGVINKLIKEHNALIEQNKDGKLKGRAQGDAARKAHNMNIRIFKLIEERKTLIEDYFPGHTEKEKNNDSH